MDECLYLQLRAYGVPPELIARVEADVSANAISDDFRMDELDGVMHSVDKWFEDDDPRLQNNPATRAADAREMALCAIEDAFERGSNLAQKERRGNGET